MTDTPAGEGRVEHRPHMGPCCLNDGVLEARLRAVEAERDRWKLQSDDWQKRGWGLGQQLDTAQAEARRLHSIVAALRDDLEIIRTTVRHDLLTVAIARADAILTPPPTGPKETR